MVFYSIDWVFSSQILAIKDKTHSFCNFKNQTFVLFMLGAIIGLIIIIEYYQNFILEPTFFISYLSRLSSYLHFGMLDRPSC